MTFPLPLSERFLPVVHLPTIDTHQRSLDGLWRCQLDPHREGVTQQWFTGLPAAREVALPYLEAGVSEHDAPRAWYQTTTWIPVDWQDQPLTLRVAAEATKLLVWIGRTPVPTTAAIDGVAADISGLVRAGDPVRITLAADSGVTDRVWLQSQA